MQSSNGTTHAWPRREFAQKLQWVGFLYTLVSRLRLIISRRKFLSVIMFLRRLRLRSRQLSWLWTAALFSQRLIHCVKAQLRRRRRRQLTYSAKAFSKLQQRAWADSQDVNCAVATVFANCVCFIYVCFFSKAALTAADADSNSNSGFCWLPL